LHKLIARLAHLDIRQQAQILLSLESKNLEIAIKTLTLKLGTPQAIILATLLGKLNPVFENWAARLRRYLSSEQHDTLTTRELILEGLRLGIYQDEAEAQIHIAFYLSLLLRRGGLVPFWDEIVTTIGLQSFRTALESERARERLGARVLAPILTEFDAL
jgi:hypothetical protein